jgi:hypothetical protein
VSVRSPRYINFTNGDYYAAHEFYAQVEIRRQGDGAPRAADFFVLKVPAGIEFIAPTHILWYDTPTAPEVYEVWTRGGLKHYGYHWEFQPWSIPHTW